MTAWPKEKELRKLIERALSETDLLAGDEVHEMVGPFDRLSQLLDTPVNGRQQLLLMLSAGVMAMKRAESLVHEAMSLDRWISHSEEAVLVHLRLICAEIIGILTYSSDDLRLVPVPVRWR
jgi:hypothetical protein